MPKVIHFEIPVDDHERAAAFYRDALGWEIRGLPGLPYWLVQAGEADEPGADGALIARGDVHRTPVLVVGVDSVIDAGERVVAAGGRVVQDRAAVPGVGWSMYVEDPEGNIVGLFQSDESAAPA
jgi:predicted enzyme related to lactoylglutathione lyase